MNPANHHDPGTKGPLGLGPVAYCPHCGQRLDRPENLINSYWDAWADVYVVWCAQCQWRGEVRDVHRVTASEPVER